MPRQWKGRTFYTLAELDAMTPEERDAVREAHRPLAFVRPEELPPEYLERTRVELARRILEREARERPAATDGP